MAIINYTDQIKYAGKGYLDAKMMPVNTYDDLKKIQMSQRFEGLTVVLTNNLPAYANASENDVYAIVGDFGFGALANFPKGDSIEIKVDDKTAMTSDLVKILGREYVAVAPIACRAFVNITKPASV